MARDAGANKVFFSSAAPAVRYPNVYGIDIPTKQELIANGRLDEEIAPLINAEWVAYQDLDALKAAVGDINPSTAFPPGRDWAMRPLARSDDVRPAPATQVSGTAPSRRASLTGSTSRVRMGAGEWRGASSAHFGLTGQTPPTLGAGDIGEEYFAQQRMRKNTAGANGHALAVVDSKSACSLAPTRFPSASGDVPPGHCDSLYNKVSTPTRQDASDLSQSLSGISLPASMLA